MVCHAHSATTTCFLLQALKKKQLVSDGKLGKFGKILPTTPQEVKEEFGPEAKPVLVAATGVETLSAATPQTMTAATRKVLQLLCKQIIENYTIIIMV